ncbi:conserved hypothetical protein [Hyphomicrobium denitrificans ATCC 51888]|uniref:Uncharacterized protein n=1 Tax=Hyphomicrobium denitrificans (strain ATCC 51888 / DSM 1869 / NCIMB 11706 / TK 0415) TaxID=582899 RepID=D8JVA1_HYPDA|nr:hypothetical protein [Hyphomicrobium denitrificans]ADJ24755.1 conserved hypothetical protein [Hyphomicrobium denitrificans ATCC 51888]
MSETYDPKILIAGYTPPIGSPWAKTGFSTDTPSCPMQTAMGFVATRFSTDSETAPRSLGLTLVQDDWGS